MDNALKSLNISSNYLDYARKNMKIGCYQMTLISSYTAMFHAGRAVLFRDGVKERSHECIPLYIKEKYPGSSGMANLLEFYRRSRHDTLYGLDADTSKEDAEAALDAAKKFYASMRDIVKGSARKLRKRGGYG